MAQKLKFGNGTWATKEGSTLAYNDENNNYKPLPFTTTRNSIGTRVNKEGLIEVVGNDVPRIDYTDSSDGVLLLENSSTNLVTYSEDISQSSWLKITGGTGVSPSITSNYTISPDGTQNASRVILNAPSVSASNLSMIRTNVSGLSSPHNISSSFYIKSNTSNNYTLLFYNGGINAIKVIANNSWQRIELSETVSSSSDRIHLGLWDFQNILTDSYADISIWGAQLEVNSVVSSYIPTNGSSVTRQADTANNAGNSEVFNSQEGIVFLDTKALANDGTTRTIGISDGSNTNRIHFINYAVVNGYSFNYRVSNTTQVAFTEVGNILDYQKIAFKYKSGDFSLWYNGFEIDTDDNTTMMSEGVLDTLSFRQEPNSFPFYGKTKEIGYYDAILTDLELETLTSYRSLSELVTELNLNTL